MRHDGGNSGMCCGIDPHRGWCSICDLCAKTALTTWAHVNWLAGWLGPDQLASIVSWARRSAGSFVRSRLLYFPSSYHRAP